MTYEDIKADMIDRIMALQDDQGCWFDLIEGDKYYDELQWHHYVPKYKSTLWTLILLADLEVDPKTPELIQPLEIVTQQFLNQEHGIFTIGKSHFPIPCLNGNMLYLHHYLQSDSDTMMNRVVDFFWEYQRFDDGDFITPKEFPYHKNQSCYGKHTCYWGVVKLFKGLSFIPVEKRSDKAKMLLQRCIDFVLKHEVCYSSHSPSEFLHPKISQLTFPNMYRGDFLEILWLLKREHVSVPQMQRAIELLKEKMDQDGTFPLESPIGNLAIPIGKGERGRTLVTHRARMVLEKTF
ncbi:MAG: hypothetical protein CVU95_15800 [Firmicutes bacterium HGW-Firmicutes-2]|jgi:hypothetical protein|nr:MAG: hypothetical protein CVU95_15800 [Firmicutes bacterium HGW-Firmicutes-2]